MAKLATRNGGPRRTSVARTPYWQPENEQWVFIPTGPTHRQSLEYMDPETNEVTFAQDQYEAKGWEAIHRVPPNDDRRKLLPENWRDMARDHKAHATFGKDHPVTKAAEADAKATAKSNG